MRRTLLASMLLLLSAAGSVAQTNPPATPPPATLPQKPPTSDQGVRKLSRAERKEKIKNLPAVYQDFLRDTEPIIAPDEVDAFLVLETDAQREIFIGEFWRRRDRAQGTTRHTFHDDYYERLDEVKVEFKYVTTERSRIYLIHGAPADRIKVENCERLVQPMEIWKYAVLPDLGHDVRLLFYSPRYGGTDYKLWNPALGNDALRELVSQQAVGQYGSEAAAVQAVFFTPEFQGSTQSRLQTECRSGDDIMGAVFWMQQARTSMQKVYNAEPVNTEDVGHLLRSVVLSNTSAPKLSAEVSVAFPAKEGSRTDTQITIQLDRAQLKVKDVEGTASYNIDVTGEVLKNDSLFENYRYRYDFPAGTKDPKIVVVIDRMLRPADYKARIKILDANSGSEAVVEKDITVPEIHDSAATAAGKDAASMVIGRMADEVASGQLRLRIVPLPDQILSGLQHIETIASGEAIKAVEFYLDGRKVMIKRQPPFTLDLDFGSVPQMRRIRAVALDGNGKPLTGDELSVNTGTDPFRVRIVSPRVALSLHGKTRVEMAATAPEGRSIESVQLFLNDKRMATLYNPPYIQTIDIPASEGIGYLRAVATLKGEAAPPVEDVVMINTPDYIEEVNVHLVEMPTTVLSNLGRVVNDLKEPQFRVLDEGKPVKISKFEHLQNLPLSIGMAVDTSGSMNISMPEAQKSGAEFFRKVLKPGDKAFLVGFDTTPSMVQKWTSKLGDLNGGLAKMRAEEATALYDAIVYSLYNFLGVRGQRALVVISDGKDTASKFSFDQALEYSRRAAVPIYGIGLGIKPADIETRSKFSRFCTETGGSVYYIENATQLHGIFMDVQNELRSQYLIGFYPPEGVKAGGKWHEVQVQVQGGKAKTIRGYYP